MPEYPSNSASASVVTLPARALASRVVKVQVVTVFGRHSYVARRVQLNLHTCNIRHIRASQRTENATKKKEQEQDRDVDVPVESTVPRF